MYEIPVISLKIVRDSSVRLTELPLVSDPEKVAGLLHTYMGDSDREHLVAILLNARNRVVGIHTIAMGSTNTIHVAVGESFKAAIVSNAAAMILGHNHPSGEAEASPEDVSLTREFVEAGELLDMPILDHVIIGQEGEYYSMKQRGVVRF